MLTIRPATASASVAVGARLYLRPTRIEEIDDTFAEMFAGIEGRNRYFRRSGRPFSRGDLIDCCRRGIEDRDVFYYSVCALNDDAVIGAVVLGPIDFKHSLSDMVALIGNVGDRGRGFGTEAIAEGIRIAFEVHNIRKLSGGILGPNVASLKAYLRAGCFEEGRLAGHYLHGGAPVDWIIVSCFNPAWRSH